MDSSIKRILSMRIINYKEYFNKYNRMLIMILESDQFFQPNSSLDKFKIINDYEKADMLYTMEYPLESLGEEEGSKYDIYVDLMNDRTPMSFENFAEFDDEEYSSYEIEFYKFENEAWKLILELEQSNPYITDRFTDYIYNDFLAFITYLAFCPMSDKLMELKLEAYINGAMPCGWYGKYPEGKLAVYVPLAE